MYVAALISPPEELEVLHELLSNEERARAARFVSDDVRRRFVAARGTLRRVLADELGAAPSALEFSYGEHGKPALQNSTTVFNLSHSGDIALIAIADCGVVGVDVEVLRDDTDFDAIAENSFSDAELAAWRALPEAEKRDAFFATWTCKEAYLKALGTGFAVSSRAFDVSVTSARATQPGATVATPHLLTRAETNVRANWRLETFRGVPSWIASVAWSEAF